MNREWYVKAIGYNIWNMRYKRNMKQTDLAEKVGIQPTYISHLENGQKEPSLALLFKIADACQFSFSDFFNFDAYNASEQLKDANLINK